MERKSHFRRNVTIGTFVIVLIPIVWIVVSIRLNAITIERFRGKSEAEVRAVLGRPAFDTRNPPWNGDKHRYCFGYYDSMDNRREVVFEDGVVVEVRDGPWK